MAATLTVEDGSRKSNANSYLALADADTYHENHGDPSAWSGATTSAKTHALIKATQYVDLVYGRHWKGTKSDEDQALDWPRIGVWDFDGDPLDNTEIPQMLKDAVAELALKSISEDLIEDVDNPGRIAEQRSKVGELEEEVKYVGGAEQSKRYRIADLLLRDLLIQDPESGSTRVARITRA